MADTKATTTDDAAKADAKKAKDEAPKPTVDSMTNPEGVDLTKGDKDAEPAYVEEK